MAECLKAIFTLDECEVNVSIKDKFKITVDDCGEVVSIPFTMEEKIATYPNNGKDGVLQRITSRRYKVPEGAFVPGNKTKLFIDTTYERDYTESPFIGEAIANFDILPGAVVSLNYFILT